MSYQRYQFIDGYRIDVDQIVCVNYAGLSPHPDDIPLYDVLLQGGHVLKLHDHYKSGRMTELITAFEARCRGEAATGAEDVPEMTSSQIDRNRRLAPESNHNVIKASVRQHNDELARRAQASAQEFGRGKG